MSRYTVVWLRDAIDELGEIWLSAKDRSAITKASANIDRELATNAKEKGNPLSEVVVVAVVTFESAIRWVAAE